MCKPASANCRQIRASQVMGGSGSDDGRCVWAVVVVVFEVAEAYAHVVVDVVGHGCGECHAEDSVRQGEGVEVAIAKEQQAGDGSPDEGEGDEDWV
jgi:hypothetical protein